MTGVPLTSRCPESLAGSTMLLAVLLLSLLVAPVSARVLGVLPPVTIEPGQELSVSVPFERVVGQRIEIVLEEAPKGARIQVSDTGHLLIRWKAPADVADETLFVLAANDIDSGARLDRRYLIIRRHDEAALVRDRQPPSFGEIPDQAIRVDQPLTIVLDATEADGRSASVTAKKLPRGAFILNRRGVQSFIWTAEEDQQGPNLIALTAVDSTDQILKTERRFIVDVLPPAETALADDDMAASDEMAVQLNTESVDDSPEDQATSESAPESTMLLAPIANQVVSAGRVIALRVAAADPERQLILQVDRLPQNASFDTNDDGSRTFYWPTTDKDQGEHVFRFGAIDPKSPEQRSDQTVMIIVGDPTRSQSLPVDVPSSEADLSRNGGS